MNLSRLIKDVQSKIEMARDMWMKLPHDLCNKTVAPPTDEEYTCWNGSTRLEFLIHYGLFMYTGRAQRPARRPLPASDESSSGPPFPIGKVTRLIFILSFRPFL